MKLDDVLSHLKDTARLRADDHRHLHVHLLAARLDNIIDKSLY